MQQSSVVFAIVGRTNVGKSTLFNRLTDSRDALVSDFPGLTRDRKYGKIANKFLLEVGCKELSVLLIDTGGLVDMIVEPDSSREHIKNTQLNSVLQSHSFIAIEEADICIFVVSALDGLTYADEEVFAKIRKLSKKIYLFINKSEGKSSDLIKGEFATLAAVNSFCVSAIGGNNVGNAIKQVIDDVTQDVVASNLSKSCAVIGDDDFRNATKVAIFGKPNVGKSTLINTLIGEKKLIAFDMPGTTRDSSFLPHTYVDKKKNHKHDFVLVDTAGVRRKSKVKNKIEKFSVVKALEALEMSNIALLVIDAQEGVTEQDAHLLGMILNYGKALMILVNKWDSVNHTQRQDVKNSLDRKFRFIDFAKIHYISATKPKTVAFLFAELVKISEQLFNKIATADINRVLQQAKQQQSIVSTGGLIKPKLNYAHLGGLNPPQIIIHGRSTDKINSTYTKYLSNYFRKSFNWLATPVFIKYVNSENPYK